MTLKKRCANCMYWSGAVGTGQSYVCKLGKSKLTRESDWCSRWTYFLDQQIRTGEKKR